MKELEEIRTLISTLGWYQKYSRLPEAEIAQAEARLGVQFPPLLKSFYRELGAHPLFKNPLCEELQSLYEVPTIASVPLVNETKRNLKSMNARERDFGDNREVTSFQNIAIKQILKLMNKYILLLLLSILINSCKSESILTGRKYQTDSINENIYTFDMKSHNYSKKMVSGTIGKGKFKTFVLSSEKILIVCNDIIWKKTASDIKEMDKTGDSVVVGVFDGYKNLGSTIFEITSKEKKLSFRKTYVNQLQQTESEGALIKK